MNSVQSTASHDRYFSICRLFQHYFFCSLNIHFSRSGYVSHCRSYDRKNRNILLNICYQERWEKISCNSQRSAYFGIVFVMHNEFVENKTLSPYAAHWVLCISSRLIQCLFFCSYFVCYVRRLYDCIRSFAHGLHVSLCMPVISTSSECSEMNTSFLWSLTMHHLFCCILF